MRQLLEILILPQEFVYRLACIAIASGQKIIQRENPLPANAWTSPSQACHCRLRVVNVNNDQGTALRHGHTRKVVRNVSGPDPVQMRRKSGIIHKFYEVLFASKTKSPLGALRAIAGRGFVHPQKAFKSTSGLMLSEPQPYGHFEGASAKHSNFREITGDILNQTGNPFGISRMPGAVLTVDVGQQYIGPAPRSKQSKSIESAVAEISR